MANQRKQGVERITLTIPDELLAQIETAATERGVDRLSLMREALRVYLSPTQRPTSKKRGAKQA